MSKHSMASIRRRKHMLCLYRGFLFLWSLSIALMPIGIAVNDNTKLVMYFSGSAFWIGAAGTIYMAFKINRCRKTSYRFNEINGDRKQFGLIHFFQSKEAIVADVVMLASITGMIIANIWIRQITVAFILSALFIFSFGMHCMLNGINYRYIKYKVRRDAES